MSFFTCVISPCIRRQVDGPDVGGDDSKGSTIDVLYGILYVVWSFASAVVLFNLLIAMMSASFQEVYDSAKKVSVNLGLPETMPISSSSARYTWMGLQVAAMEKALVLSRIDEKLSNPTPLSTLFRDIFGGSVLHGIEYLQLKYHVPTSQKTRAFLEVTSERRHSIPRCRVL